MNPTASDPADCCADYARANGLSRRGFLAGMTASAGVLAAGQLFGDAALSATFGSTRSNVLVVLSFRGGIDGLGMVVPHGDPGYYAARPSIAVPKSSLLAADGTFGLHPELAPLLPLWQSGRMAAVHAVGMEAPNRSHFEAMELVEDADPASSVRSGWVNRMIGLDGLASPTEAMHLTSSISPTLLSGPQPTLATNGLDGLQLAGSEHEPARRYAAWAKTWESTSGVLGDAARSASQVSRTLGSTLKAPYRPANGAIYARNWPGTDLANALTSAAHLIKADVGTQVISIDFGSWDMHASYGTLEWGSMQSMLGAFAANVAAFFTDLGDLGERVTVATISEFGRRVAQNGSGGLDHGWGNAMLLLGGGVRGGRYYGRWPGLGDGKLVAGDVEVTTDYRNVLGEIVARRFPERSVSKVFPGLSYAPLGLLG